MGQSRPILPVLIHEWKNNCRGSPQRVRGPSPTSCFPASGPAPGRQVPKTLGFEGQGGLLLGKPEGYGKQRLHSEGRHKTSPTPGPREEVVIRREPESELPDGPGAPPGEAGGNQSSPWGHRHQQQTIRGTGSTVKTLMLTSEVNSVKHCEKS